MAILTTGNSYSDGNQITSSNLNAIVNSATFSDPIDTSSGLNLTSDSPPKIAINTALSNKTLTGGSLNNCPIGAVTASTGAFTSLSASGGYTGDVTGGTGSFTTLTASGDVTFDTTTLKVDSTNNRVGIGTASPAMALDVVGAGTITAGLNVGINDDTAGLINILGGGDTEEGGELRLYNANDHDGSYEFWRVDSGSGGAFRIGRTGQTDFTILQSGYVGIGNTNPDKLLVVSGAGAEVVIDDTDSTDTPHLRFRESGTTSATISTDASDIIFDTGTTERMRIKSDGRIGIGTNFSTSTIAADFHIRNTGDASIIIEADTLDSDEEANPNLVFKQDGGNVSSSIGSLGSAGEIFTDSIINATYFGNSQSTPLQFFTNSAARMTLDASGNVGIGTASPLKKLHIASDANGQTTADIPGIRIENTDTTAIDTNVTGEIEFFSKDASEADKISGFIKNIAEDAGTKYGLAFGAKATGSNATEAVRIDSSGNVGIGDSSPSYKLDVNGTGRFTGVLSANSDLEVTGTIKEPNDSGNIVIQGGNGANIELYGTGHSNASEARYDANTHKFRPLGSSDNSLIILQNGNVGINVDAPSHKLDVNGTGRFVNDLTLDEDLVHNLTGSGSLPGYSADGTGGTFGAVLEDGGANGSTLYMARKNSWALYLATDTNLNPQSDTGKKKVVQFADLYNQTSTQGNVVGNIAINDSSTAFNTSSDYRLKENEVDITDGIDRLKQLKPYRFNFIRNPSEVLDGFFAHEVSPVVPESITGSKDAVDEEGKPDYQGIDQSKLVPLLTAALQEAVTKIEALEARVATLEG